MPENLYIYIYIYIGKFSPQNGVLRVLFIDFVTVHAQKRAELLRVSKMTSDLESARRKPICRKSSPLNLILTRLWLILCFDNAYNGWNRDFTPIFMSFPQNRGRINFFTILTPKMHVLTPKRIF
jgi:hypothetical protein